MINKDLIELIDKKIVGQGSMVDMGGGLGPILKALVGVEVEDITKIPNEVLDALVVGSPVIKVTGKQRHLYLVSYKGEGAGEGICISYNAAGYGETVSYDRTDDGWAYNSTDVKTYGE